MQSSGCSFTSLASRDTQPSVIPQQPHVPSTALDTVRRVQALLPSWLPCRISHLSPWLLLLSPLLQLFLRCCESSGFCRDPLPGHSITPVPSLVIPTGSSQISLPALVYFRTNTAEEMIVPLSFENPSPSSYLSSSHCPARTLTHVLLPLPPLASSLNASILCPPLCPGPPYLSQRSSWLSSSSHCLREGAVACVAPHILATCLQAISQAL